MLNKIERREDARPIKKKPKEPNPDWATLDQDTKMLPSTMYVTPTADEVEDAITREEEIKYRKLKVKNIPIIEVPIGVIES